MGMIMDSIAEWLKEILVGGIISNLSGMFDSVNGQVGEIAVQVGTTPQAWNGTIYSMIRTLSENVMVPIAGVILAFVMTLELIQMVADKNNMHGDVDTWMFFKWISSSIAVSQEMWWRTLPRLGFCTKIPSITMPSSSVRIQMVSLAMPTSAAPTDTEKPSA